MLTICFIFVGLIAFSGAETTTPLQSHESGINYLTGFNPITTEFLSPIFHWTFHLNLTSNILPGIPIPDQLAERVNSESHYKIRSEICKRITDVKDLKNTDISVSAKWKKIFGSYCYDKTSNAETFKSSNHHLIRTWSKYQTHELILIDGNLKFNPDFEGPIHLVAKVLAHFNQSQVDIEELINWNLDYLLRTVGPTYVWLAKFGAIINLDQVVDRSKSTRTTDDQVKQAASAGFGTIFKASLTQTTDHQTKNEFDDMLTSQVVNTYGGLPWTPNTTIAEFVETISLRPTLIDYEFRETVDLINGINFPEIDSAILDNIRHRFIGRTLRFYDMNTVPGCTDPDSLNYCWFCNQDDNSCHQKDKHLRYGGQYRQGSYPKKNPWTQEFKCQANYSDVELYDGSFTSWSRYWTRECHHHGFLGLHKKCQNIPHDRGTQHHQNIHICLSQDGSTNGYYFNGMYSNKAANSVTGDHACSADFDDELIFKAGPQPEHAIRVCQKPFDTVQGAPEGAVKFGGMFNCHTQNWLTGTFGCGTGYMKHPLGTFQNCDWFCCIDLKDMKHKQVYYEPGFGTTNPSFPVEVLNELKHKTGIDLIQDTYPGPLEISPENSSDDNDSGSSVGTVLGILAAGLVLSLAGGCYLRYRWRKRRGYGKV